MVKHSDLSIHKAKSGKTMKWQGYFYYYDADGNRKQKTKISKQKTKKAAKPELQGWMDEWLAEYEKTPAGASGETVDEVVQSYIDYQLSRNLIERSTYAVACSNLNRYVKPYDIGSIGFFALDKIDIDIWLTKLAEVGLKQSTIHTAYALLNKTYNYYYHQGRIVRNPFEYVTSPKKPSPKVTYLTKEEMDRMIVCLNYDEEAGSPLWTAINLALLAGLRRGEICGLRWHDVDLESKTLSVSTSIGVTNKKYGVHDLATYAKNPKNEASARSFPIVGQLVEVLEVRRSYVKKQYGAINSSWFVIGDTIHYEAPTSLSRKVTTFMERNDIVDFQGKRPSLHSLRHNFATMGVNAHMDIASLSRMMGHASKAMTLDTYASSSPDAMKKAAEKLQEGFRDASECLEVWN